MKFERDGERKEKGKYKESETAENFGALYIFVITVSFYIYGDIAGSQLGTACFFPSFLSHSLTLVQFGECLKAKAASFI